MPQRQRIHPAAGLEDLVEHERHRPESVPEGKEIDLGHEEGQLEELLPEHEEQDKTRTENEKKD
jgi:hypothetical protein